MEVKKLLLNNVLVVLVVALNIFIFATDLAIKLTQVTDFMVYVRNQTFYSFVYRAYFNDSNNLSVIKYSRPFREQME